MGFKSRDVVFNACWLDAVSWPPNRDHVETGCDPEKFLPLQVTHCRSRDPLLFSLIDSIRRMTRSGRRERFDFDENNDLLMRINGNQIDLAKSIGFALCDHDEPFLTEQACRGLFSPLADWSPAINRTKTQRQIAFSNDLDRCPKFPPRLHRYAPKRSDDRRPDRHPRQSATVVDFECPAVYRGARFVGRTLLATGDGPLHDARGGALASSDYERRRSFKRTALPTRFRRK